jgi:hypothetical protein
LARKLRGVGFVDLRHHDLVDAGEARLATVVVVHDARRRGRLRVDDVIGGSLCDARRFTQMVIEGQVHARHVRHVGGDVSFADLHLAVLHVFRMHELDVIQNAELLEQHGTHEPVEITTRHQPEFLGHQAATATSPQTEAPLRR